MNSLQLEKIFEYYGKNKLFYYGIFPIDKLPVINGLPACLIINNQPSNKEGQHWIAIYFDKNRKCEFFDSFGKSPHFYGVNNYLRNNSKTININRKIIQSNISEYCGLYCIFFLIFKLKGRSMTFYNNLFKKNPIENDKMFSKWINKIHMY